MSFQLFDLKGRPKETGTIEEWWAAPGRFRTVITSPSFTYTTPSSVESLTAGDQRTSVLTWMLLKQATDPIPTYRGLGGLYLRDTERKVGAAKLSCIRVATQRDTPIDDVRNPQFCTEPGRQVLRVSFEEGDLSLIRNNMIEFLKTSLARDYVIKFGSYQAISGHVDLLETYNPDKDPVELTSRPMDDQKVPGVMLEGKMVKSTRAEYPSFAFATRERVGGAVIVEATIRNDGHIADTNIIASPDPSLSSAAIATVKQWEYSPFLLDGVPVQVRAIFTVNYGR